MRSSCEPRLWIPQRLKRQGRSIIVLDTGEIRDDPEQAPAEEALESPVAQEPQSVDRTPRAAEHPGEARIQEQIRQLGLTGEYLDRSARAAASLVERGRSLSETLKTRAWEEGYQEGLKRGAQEAEKLKETALDMVRQARQARIAAAEEAKEELIRFSLQVARRVINRELATDPTVVLDMLREALELMPRGVEIMMRAHPTFVQAVQDAGDLNGGNGGGQYQLTCLADEDMDPGDFLLETIYGEVDGRIDTQLERLAQEISGRIQEAEGES